MKAQGYDPAFLKIFHPDQQRVPAGNGRESGEWTDGGAVSPASFRTRGRIKALSTFLEWLRGRTKGPNHESPPEKSPPREQANPAPKPSSPSHETLEVDPSRPKPSDFVGQDFGKLGVGVEKPDLQIRKLSTHTLNELADRGGSLTDIQTTVENPLIVLRQSDGRILYLSDKAVVVLDQMGTVVTSYPATRFDATIRGILDRTH